MKLNSLRLIVPVTLLLLIVISASGCTANTQAPSNVSTPASPSPAATPEPSNKIALNVTGLVSNPLQYTIAQLNARPRFKANITFKDNISQDITGISLNALMDDMGIKPGATSAVFRSDDGYEVTMALSDIRASPDAMIYIGLGLPSCCSSDLLADDQMKLIVPGQPFKTWVSRLVTIEIQ